jgi:ThiF family
VPHNWYLSIKQQGKSTTMRCPLRKQYTFFFVGRFFWTLYHAACLGDAKMRQTSFGMAPMRIPRRTFFGNALVHVRSTARAAATLSHDEIRRYARHLVLSDVGMAGQAALKDAAVLVIGAGGLGSPALLYLAAAGVGHVGIVDADAVDESNLQRQIIHRMTTLGRSKCQSARQAMNELNPHVHVRLYEEEFTSQSAPRIVGDGFAPEKPWDIIIDGSDNFPTKYLIKYVGWFEQIVVVSVSAVRLCLTCCLHSFHY